jgi:hypothetical protein
MEKKLAQMLEQMNIGGRHQHDALLMLENHVTGKKRFIWGRNIVTTAGNVYYAQSAVAETPTNAFGPLYLSTAGPATPAVTDDYTSFDSGQQAEKACDGGYPKTDDDDTDNTGATPTTVTWRHSFATTDGPYTAIQWSFISVTSAAAASPILNSYKWASAWDKDASTSAKVFSNHTFLGS